MDPQSIRTALLTANEKPPVQPVNVDAIPDEIKRLRRWVAWRWYRKKGKWTKVPINARTGGNASSTDPKTWCDFETALAFYKAGRAAGIGVVLGDGLAGIDLDVCRDPQTGELSPLAKEIIAACPTYWEASPSAGTGVKGFIYGTLPEGHKTSGRGVEVYTGGRFFCATGQRIDDSSERIEQRQAELEAVHKEYVNAPKPKNVVHRPRPPQTDGVNPAAFEAMVRIGPKPDEKDGSNRLFAWCCRAVAHDLDDESAIATILAAAEHFPFPKDWTDDEIRKRLEQAEKKVARGCDRNKIDVTTLDLQIATKQAWDAIRDANEPARFFRFGSVAARIETGDDGAPEIRRLNPARMRYHLARVATFHQWSGKGNDLIERIVPPPMPVVQDVLATPDQPLPVLTRIVEAPVFAADDTLQTTPGYHRASQTYYAPAAGFIVPDVPEHPSKRDIACANILLRRHLLRDFPFVGDSELAHAMALVLLPFVRDLIAGPTPLHLIEKPCPGSGGTLLADMLAYPAIGRPIPTMTEARDEDEWRKRLTAKLCSSSPYIFIDNLRNRLDSAAVSSAITATTYEDRILGASEMARLPVRCCWVATGNNPAVSDEIARRTVRIRLDAKMANPWLGRKFRHPNLREWAEQNRGELVWAALTLIRAWIVAGRPKGEKSLGMFERWAEVMGGILDVANVPGFLCNLSEFYRASDDEGATWQNLIAAWWERHEKKQISVKQLCQPTTDETGKELPSLVDEAGLTLGDGSEQSQRIKLGKMLAQRKDRVFELDDKPGKVALCQGTRYQGAYGWHLAIAP